MNVLIADDSVAIRENLRALVCEIPGVKNVFEASGGWEALAQIMEKDVDLLVLDLRMPSGSGLELLESLEKMVSSVTVIVVTAYPFPQYREKCLAAGASYFFDKAAGIEKVVETIRMFADSGFGADKA